MAKNEKDISEFYKNKSFRKVEMESYFHHRIWNIIAIIENDYCNNRNEHSSHKKNHKYKV